MRSEPVFDNDLGKRLELRAVHVVGECEVADLPFRAVLYLGKVHLHIFGLFFAQAVKELFDDVLEVAGGLQRAAVQRVDVPEIHTRIDVVTELAKFYHLFHGADLRLFAHGFGTYDEVGVVGFFRDELKRAGEHVFGAGERRFAREISSVSGADSVVFCQGMNDIVHPAGADVDPYRPMSDLPANGDLERGAKGMFAVASSNGLNVYACTLSPIKGWRIYAPVREELRQNFNSWLRSQADIAGCIDFDELLKDDSDGLMLAARYDCGDHLHPSENALKAMAKLAFEHISGQRD